MINSDVFLPFHWWILSTPLQLRSTKVTMGMIFEPSDLIDAQVPSFSLEQQRRRVQLSWWVRTMKNMSIYTTTLHLWKICIKSTFDTFHVT